MTCDRVDHAEISWRRSRQTRKRKYAIARKNAILARMNSGLSVDSQASHERFKSKYSLPFTLLADPEHKLGGPYGVEQEGKSSYERSTFVIDADGNVAKIFRRVKPDQHADQVLAALSA